MSRHTSLTQQRVDSGAVLYTQCDSCLTVFRITPRDLRTADGRVCCCFCNRAFQALDSLTDVLPSALLAEATAPKPAAEDVETEPYGPATAIESVVALQHELEREPRAGGPDEIEPHNDVVPTSDDGDIASGANAEPDLAGDHLALDGEGEIPDVSAWQVEAVYFDREVAEVEPRAGRAGSTVFWSIGIGVLLALLLLQTAYAARAELARYPVMRPLLDQMCMVIGCELPPRRAVDRIHVVDRQVIAHPNADDALQVSAHIDNRAEFAQPYPILGLTFFDRGGQRAGQRWFGPEEYLADPTAADGLMQPGEPAAVRLELLRPERGGDSYEFEFR